MIPQALSDSVQRVRGLELMHQVPCSVKTAAELEQILNESLAINNEDEAIAQEEAMLRLLGFLDFGDSYAEFLERYFRGSIGGFYSPRLKQLVTNSSLEGERGEEILAHELTHALQDQHFGLSQVTTEHVTTDCSLARLAVVEGDANRVMALVKGRDPCARSKLPGIDLEQHQDEFNELKPAHASLLRLYSFPYRYGTQFVCDVIHDQGLTRLNELITSSPSSTAQIMGLPIEGDGERKCLPRPESDSLDSLGIFGVFSLLSEWLELPEAKSAAEGLSADELIWKGSQLEWTLRWWTAAEAVEFAQVFRKSQQIRFELNETSPDISELNSFQNTTLSVSLFIKDSVVRIVFSPISALQMVPRGQAKE